MKTNIISIPDPILCPKCGINESRAYSVAGRECREICDACLEADRMAAAAEREAARFSGAAERFASICRRFPAYDPKTTDWRLVSPAISKAAGEWMQRDDPARGLWLCGPTRLGKTRVMFGLMARLAAMGKTCGYTNHQQVCDWIASAAMRVPSAISAIETLRRSDVLLIDDLGKGRPTETATAGIYGLLEWFTSRARPVVLTSQAAGEWMHNRFGEDGGEAIVGRLTTFCELVEARPAAASRNSARP